MEVLAHEATILRDAGHEVEQYTVAPAEQLGLSGIRLAAKAVWNHSVYNDVRKLVSAYHPNVAHVHTPFPVMSPAVFRAASGAGIPTVATLHSFRYSCIAATCLRDDRICEDCVGSRTKWPGVAHRCYHDSVGGSAALTIGLGVHRAIGTFARQVSQYVALTEFSRQLLIRDGFPASRITVKPNSVPDPGVAWQPDTQRPFVAFAGRLIGVKGIATLLDAWCRLDCPGWRLRIAGDGVLRDLVEERARRDPSIEYLGWLTEDDLDALYGTAQLVVLPSQWYEGGLPLVVMRSLSMGTPVLVSDIENFAGEVLRDRAGWTFPTGDPAGLARVLGELLADLGWMDAARERARAAYLHRYTPAVNLRKLESLYGRLTSTRDAEPDPGQPWVGPASA